MIPFTRCLAAGLFSVMLSPVHAATPPAVTVVAAVTGEIAEKETVTGSLAAREEILVGPQVDGLTVTEILAEEGDRVQKGQILVRLSRDTLEAAVAQSAAQVAKADASAVQARAQIEQGAANVAQTAEALSRSRQLASSGVASRETLEQRDASAKVAASQVDIAKGALASAVADRSLAEAQLQDAIIRLKRTDVRAPAAGVVIRRTVRIGATASMASEPMFRIAAAGDIELDANVPEAVLGRLSAGQTAEVEIAGRTGLRLGSVRLVSPEVGASTRLGRVRIAITDGPGLAVGGFARARIELARAPGVLVPLSAVLFRQDAAEIQVVRNGTVETRRVKVGLRDTRSAQITEGITVGEEVVSVSGSFVRNGDLVTAVHALPAVR